MINELNQHNCITGRHCDFISPEPLHVTTQHKYIMLTVRYFKKVFSERLVIPVLTQISMRPKIGRQDKRCSGQHAWRPSKAEVRSGRQSLRVAPPQRDSAKLTNDLANVHVHVQSASRRQVLMLQQLVKQPKVPITPPPVNCLN